MSTARRATLIGLRGAKLMGLRGAKLVGVRRAKLVGVRRATLMGLRGAKLVGVRRAMLVGLATLAVLAGSALLAGAPALAIGGLEVAAPSIDGQSASGITPFDAALEAGIETNNQFTEYELEYAASEAEVLLGHGAVVGAGGLVGSLGGQGVGPFEIGGLTPASTYYFRVVASNTSGRTEGAVQSFTTLATEKPAVETGYSPTVWQAAATFSGTVNPVFQSVTGCEFQYVAEATYNATGFSGTPASLPCGPAAGELGVGDSPVSVSAIASGLAANTSYYYRLVATNATGTTDGPARFLPTAETGGASAVSAYGATISGTVNPGSGAAGAGTTYYFQYSTDTSYNAQVPLEAQATGASAGAVPEHAELTGLEPGTTYHYRIVGVNIATSAYGEGRTFTTPATPPVLGPVAVAAVTPSSATISTTIAAENLTTHYELRLGSTQGSLPIQAVGSLGGFGVQPIALEVGSLAPGSVHYYKLIIANADGTVESPEAAFTTAPGPPPPPPATSTPPLALPNVTFPTEEPATSTTSTSSSKRANTKKLNKALKECRKKRSRRKQATCEKQARKKHG
jgi:hypothetical protein